MDDEVRLRDAPKRKDGTRESTPLDRDVKRAGRAAAPTTTTTTPTTASPAPESDVQLYCLCREQFEDERVMIACDRCDEWYHAACVHIREDDVDRIDVFICPICEPHTDERTSYKAPCQRVGCTQPARLPLSKFCSDSCGRAAILARLQQRKEGRTPEGRARFAMPTISPPAPCGVTIWSDPSVLTDAPRTLDAAWIEHLRASLHPQILVIPPGQSVGAYVRDHATVLATATYEAARLTSELAALEAQQASVHATLDLLGVRSKLLQVLEDQQSSLPPPSDGSGPCCGFDARLCWDDEPFAAWVASPEGRALVADETVDSHLDMVCLLAKRRCKRHADWSAIRGAELDVLREAHTSHLSALAERIQHVRVALQRVADQT